MRLMEYVILGIVCLFLLTSCSSTPKDVFEDMVKDVQAKMQSRSKLKEQTDYYQQRKEAELKAKALREEEMAENRKKVAERDK